MKEQKMSIEQVRAMIEKMHASLEDLEKALNEGVLEGDEKWMFPEGNYTVLAIWLLYDPRARRLFAVNERKSWVELAERLTKYVEWTVDWDCLRRNYTRKSFRKTKKQPSCPLKTDKLSSHRSGKSSNFAADFHLRPK